MITKKDRAQVLLLDVAKDTALAASVQISSVENGIIDSVLQRSHAASEEKLRPCWQHIPREHDKVLSVLAAVLPILNDQTLYELMQGRANLGRFQMSIGATDSKPDAYLAHNTASKSDDSSVDDGEAINELFAEST